MTNTQSDALRCSKCGAIECSPSHAPDGNFNGGHAFVHECPVQIQTPNAKLTHPPLAKAIEALGAVEVAPGRYAFKPRGLAHYVTMSADDTAHVANLDGDEYEGYVDACGVAMPSWWTPELTRCVKVTGPNGTVYVREDDYRQFGKPRNSCAERITADLETGEEVPA